MSPAWATTQRRSKNNSAKLCKIQRNPLSCHGNRQERVCRLPQSKNGKDSEYVSQEKEYWEECFSWNSEKSIGLCAARKNEKLSKMAEKSRIEMPRRKKMEKIRWGVLGTAGIARDCSIPGMQKAEKL